jgi:hypothetical protein
MLTAALPTGIPGSGSATPDGETADTTPT